MAKKRNAEVVNEWTEVLKEGQSNLNNERRSKQMNADDSFQKPSKKARTKLPMQRPPKEFVEYKHTKLKLRCSPSEFMSKIKIFTEAQKSDVRNMGFGSILTMDIYSIATGLGYWLLVNYDEETNTLNMGNHKLKITASNVHEIFGIPMGKIKILEKNKPRKGAHSTIDEFKNQFDISRISVGKVTPLMEQLKDGGRLFKLNFLVVWNTVFGEITKSTTVNQRFLRCIDDESEIPKMDWCSYMIDCLRRTKESWKGDNDQYNGPVALLAILYTHEYQKRHNPQDQIKTPAIVYIKSETLDNMEAILYNNGPLRENENEEENIELTKGNVNANTLISTKNPDKENHTKNESDKNNESFDDDYTISTAKTPQARIRSSYEKENENTSASVEKQDQVVRSENDNDMHNDDYTGSDHLPLNTDMNFGPSTQKFGNDCITHPQVMGDSTYVGNDQHEASKKAKKVWITTMDKNINKYNKIVAEMEGIVKKAKSKYALDEEIMERCHKWQSILKTTRSVENENQIAISLTEDEGNGKGHEVEKKDGKNSSELQNEDQDIHAPVRQQLPDNVSSSGVRWQEVAGAEGVGAVEGGGSKGYVRHSQPYVRHAVICHPEGTADYQERISRAESLVAMLRRDMGYVQAQQQWMMTHIASLVEAAGLTVEPRPPAPAHDPTSGSSPLESPHPDLPPS